MKVKVATWLVVPLAVAACCLIQPNTAAAQSGSGSAIPPSGSGRAPMQSGSGNAAMQSGSGNAGSQMDSGSGTVGVPPAMKKTDANVGTAIFAGGCFWCEEANFDKIPGVVDVVSGYTGGHVPNPTYREVCSDTTGHRESVMVTYDKSKLDYNDMLQYYWRTINPTDAGGSFFDRGEPYTSAIFVANDEQRKLAEASRKALAESGRFKEPIVTKIIKATKFYPAETYHQDYHLKHPKEYYAYRNASGRDQYIKHVWGKDAVYQPPKREASNAMMETKAKGSVMQWTDAPVTDYKKPSDEELRKKLTNLQYWVTQESGTEPPFKNPYWNEHREGIFVDVVSGEPLFSSKDKFQSGTGWPSFSKPIVKGNLERYADNSLSMQRTEVRSSLAHSHVGHIFNDGPPPTGLRYCTDSASLRFIPKDKMKAEGYGFFLSQFEGAKAEMAK